MSKSQSRLNLARKYRPQSLSELMGQPAAVTLLNEAIQKDQIAPAYLFSGPRGVGKTSTARIFAKAASCLETDPKKKACGVCKSCVSLKENQSMDILEIDGASHTGVDDVRSLIDAAAYRPSFGKRKVFIVDEVHMLSQAAFNALLKTLEEPPPHALFLFATTEAEKIPSTILSRVQRVELRRLSEKLISENLQKICEQEKIKTNAECIQQIAVAADGSLRDAQTLTEQMLLLSGGDILNTEVVDNFLGTIGSDREIRLFEMIAARNQSELIKQIRHFYERGKDLRNLSLRLVDWARAAVLSKSTGDWSLLADDYEKTYLDRLKMAFTDWNVEDLDRLFEILWSAADRLKRSDQAHIVLEVSLLRACRLISTVDLSNLIAHLDELQIEASPASSVNTSSRVTAASPNSPRSRASEKKPADEKPEKKKLSGKEEVLGLLKAHKGGLYSLLVSAQKLDFSSNTLSAEYSKGHFAYRQISEPFLQKELESFLNEVSTESIRLTIKESGEEVSKRPSKKNFIQSAKSEILNDPELQKIAQDLNGKLSEVTVEGIKV